MDYEVMGYTVVFDSGCGLKTLSFGSEDEAVEFCLNVPLHRPSLYKISRAILPDMEGGKE